MDRLGQWPPEKLSGDDQALYEYLNDIGETRFKNGFVWKSESGALQGPLNIALCTPSLGKRFFDLATALFDLPLPFRARELTILAVAGHYQAAFELYAHGKVARNAGGLSSDQIRAVTSGHRPEGLDAQEEICLDVTHHLLQQHARPLPAELWTRAVDALTRDGAIALMHIVGSYSYLSILFNAFDSPVPQDKDVDNQSSG